MRGRGLLLLLLTCLMSLAAPSLADAAPGDLDPTFGSGGLLTPDFGMPAQASGLALQGDGKLVVVGVQDGQWLISRFNPDGSPDTSFSGDGRETLSMGGTSAASAVVLQPDGKLVVVGSAVVGGVDEFGVARFDADGSLDASFGTNGIQTTAFSVGAGAADVGLQSNGKLVVVGYTEGTSADYALARYDTDGSLDTTFGTDGTQTIDFNGSSSGATSVAIQPDDKIVVVGDANHNSDAGDFGVARLTADGSLDSSFGNGGKQTTAFTTFAHAGASDVALQPDGKIIVVGDAYSDTSDGTGDADGGEDFGFVRYNPDGSLDTSFYGVGQRVVGYGAEIDLPSSVAIAPDGRILAAGVAQTPDFTYGVELVRLNPSGQLDRSFGDVGHVMTPFPGADYAYAQDMAIQPDGQIVVAGYIADSFDDMTNVHLAMARYEGGGPPPAPQPPRNITLPQIEGTPTVGAMLEASRGLWTGDTPLSYSWQWLRDGQPIDGATWLIYGVQPEDQGHELAATVTATNESGHTTVTTASLTVPSAGGGGGGGSGGGSGGGGTSPGGGAASSTPPAGITQPPAGTGSTPPPASSTATVGRVTVKPGAVLLRLTCSAGSGCPTITASLSVVEHLRGSKVTAVSASKRRVTTRVVVIGKVTTHLVAGHSALLTLHLNHAGRQLLKRFKRLSGQLVVRSGRRQVAVRRVGVKA